MQFTIQLIFWAIGLPLSLLVIAAMLRGGYRLFPILFLYQIVDFLMTVAGMPLYLAYYFHHDPGGKASMALWFWWDETVMQPLVYAVVVSLVFRATEKNPARWLVRGAFMACAVLIAGASFLFYNHSEMADGAWIAFWTRDLNFSFEFLDFALWGLLLSARFKDKRLLLVTGGLGIQFSGEAIGEWLRSTALQHNSRSLSFAGSFVTTLVDLTSLYIIWQAFRTAKAADAERAAIGQAAPR